MLLIDTGLLIKHLRGQNTAIQLLRGLSKSQRLAISSVSRVEIIAGMHPHESYQTKKFLSRFYLFEVNSAIADRAGEIIYNARKNNEKMMVPDAIIAATALVQNCSLVTLNVKDFKAVSNLSLHHLSS